MIALAMLLAAAQDGPWVKYAQTAQAESPSYKEGDTATNPKTGERLILRGNRWVPILGPGPHTLVVSDGNGMTRMDYKTGPACERARNSLQLQMAPPPNTANIIYGPPRITAACIPR